MQIDGRTVTHPPSDDDRAAVTVYKLDHLGREVWSYPAKVLTREDHRIRVEAFFNRDDMDLGDTIFKRGDRFVETFYNDRWYNIFAVYDRDDGRLKGWYCNIARPAAISETSVSCEDLALDVWVNPDGRPTVLDEDEFAALAIDPADRDQAESALRRLLELSRNGELTMV